MKQQALTYTAIALAGLTASACGSPQDEDTSAPAGQVEPVGDGAMEDLLDHVAAGNDAEFEPEVETVPEANLQLDGPLAEGSWRDAGIGGMEYGQDGMAPVAGLRCEADSAALIVSVPVPPDGDPDAGVSDLPPAPQAPGEQGGAEADSAEDATSDVQTRAGSLITANGTVTGMFQAAEGRDRWREMRISADEAVLDGLPREGRIGVGVENEETRLMPLTDPLLANLEACVDAADPEDGRNDDDAGEGRDNGG
ncbi:MAG: hypothetical protein U9P68_06750 [Pseudomonadota bacterium]|nr:hypothetical protein [Pseudomonadota bacterium]